MQKKKNNIKKETKKSNIGEQMKNKTTTKVIQHDKQK